HTTNLPFTFYRKKDHKKVEVSSLAKWEQQRWEILQGMEEVMGPLPNRSSLPSLDMQVKETFKAVSYTRLTINFRASKHEEERIPAYLYIPHRKGLDGQLAAMVALHPTGALGKKIVDGQSNLPNRAYAKE